jgi:hypothetical protein
VTAVLVEQNEPVEKGTPLFQFDSRPYEYHVRQLEAQLAKAKLHEELRAVHYCTLLQLHVALGGKGVSMQVRRIYIWGLGALLAGCSMASGPLSSPPVPADPGEAANVTVYRDTDPDDAASRMVFTINGEGTY